MMLSLSCSNTRMGLERVQAHHRSHRSRAGRGRKPKCLAGLHEETLTVYVLNGLVLVAPATPDRQLGPVGEGFITIESPTMKS